MLVVFFSALLFVVTSLMVSGRRCFSRGSKVDTARAVSVTRVLLDFLGEMFGSWSENEDIFQSVACCVLLLVLPDRLLASWSMGYTLLSPHVFFSHLPASSVFPNDGLRLDHYGSHQFMSKSLFKTCNSDIVTPFCDLYLFHAFISSIGGYCNCVIWFRVVSYSRTG